MSFKLTNDLRLLKVVSDLYKSQNRLDNGNSSRGVESMNINELGKCCNESHVGRALLIALLVLLLQIPIAAIEQVVVERKEY